MSVEKMQLINIVGQIEKFDEMADKLFNQTSFHPEISKEFLNKFDTITQFNERNPFEIDLNKALETLSVLSLAPKYCSFGSNGMSEQQMYSYFEDINNYVNNFNIKKAELNNLIKNHQHTIDQISPLTKIDITLEELLSFSFVAFRIGKIPIDSYEKYKLFIHDNEDVFFIAFSTTKNSVLGMYLSPQSSIEKADNMFKTLHFDPIELPSDVNGTPKDVIEHITDKIDDLKLQIENLEKKYSEYIESQKELTLSCYCKILKESETFNLKKYAARSDNNFYLLGWVPENEVQTIVKIFENDENVFCVPIKENSEEVEIKKMPPTKLKNFVLFRPFEIFLEMYAMPSYNEFDPTPLIAFTYSILFGIMFGDVGQGAVLILAGLFMAYKMKFALGKVISTVGVFSVIFGLFYGSVFGYEHILPFGFKTMHNGETINTTLIGAIFIGIMCICMVILVNIINGIRQKNIEKILFDFNGLAGLIFYVAVVVGIILMLGFGQSVFTPAYIAIFVVLPLFLMFFRHPLSKLVTGNKNWLPKNIASYIMENFFEVFEVMLSFVTNTISFIRVGAFALNHAGMMMVVFILAKTGPHSENLIIVILGNALVILMEGLIVGVQVMRLHYFEFFSRFYSGQGREFKPVNINYSKKTY